MVLATIPKHKHTTYDKKRQGAHHRHSKHYTKTYWPYLPMLLVVVAGLILNATWHTGRGVLGYATNTDPVTLLQETNSQRDQNGVAALGLNDKLSAAAQAKANDMVAQDYWAHVSPSGKQPWQFIAEAGYSYVTAGENLAYGFNTGPAVIAGWMNSPEHRANLLNTTYKDVGFGVANSANYQNSGEETVVVAMYAEPQPIAAPIAAPVKVTPAPTAPKPAVTAVTPTVTAQPTTTTAPPATQKATPTSTAPKQTTETISDLPTRQVARINILTNGNAQWSALALSVIASVCMLWFVIRHARLWRRYLLKGEIFMIKHPAFDTALLAIGVMGFVLTQTIGFIR